MAEHTGLAACNDLDSADELNRPSVVGGAVAGVLAAIESSEHVGDIAQVVVGDPVRVDRTPGAVLGRFAGHTTIAFRARNSSSSCWSSKFACSFDPHQQ